MRAAGNELQVRLGGTPAGNNALAHRRVRPRHVSILCLLFLLALAAPGPAQASPETLAGSGTGAGQVDTPVGLAVDQSTGDFYVAERNGLRISKFDAAGNFLLAWGAGVRDGTPTPQTCGPEATPPTVGCLSGMFASGIFPTAVAVDPTSGAVYVVSDDRRLIKYSPSGDLIYMVGRDVNQTKTTEGASQAERNFCTAASGDTCWGHSFETGSGPNEFIEPTAVAVDTTGRAWVGDTDRLVSFDSTGVEGASIALPGAGNTTALSLDSSNDFYVINEAIPGVRKLEAGTGTLLETLDSAGFATAVAIDATDNVYVGDCGSSENICPAYYFKVYSPDGDQTFQFGAGEVAETSHRAALAVGNAAERLYVGTATFLGGAQGVIQAFPLPQPGPLVESQGAEDILPTSAKLTATLNAEGDQTTYYFEYGTSTGYGTATPSETLPGSGFDPQHIEAPLDHLLPNTTYHFRVVATNHCDPAQPSEECTVRGPDGTFTTPPAVQVMAQWLTNVTSATATLHAILNPFGVGAEAWVEYGTSTAYGTTLQLAYLPSGLGELTREAVLNGLQPGTTYHFRVVARAERDGTVFTVNGPDGTFTTQSGSQGLQLPDQRVWEMVSPPNKYGGRLITKLGQLQASAGGDALAYISALSIEPNPDGSRTEASTVLARRTTGGVWNSKDITSPNDRVVGTAIGNEGEFKLFSPNLSLAVLEPRSHMPLSPEASERTPYLRHNTEPPSYTPLVTGKEGFANVPPGTEFGGVPKYAVGSVEFVGANPELTHVIVDSKVPLVADAPPLALYEWANGALDPVSVLPDDEEGGAIVQSTGVGSVQGSIRGAVSADGSRVFWSTGQGYPNFDGLYLRDTEADVSARLDTAQTGASESGPVRPTFQGASADGEVVFFTDTHQLTPDASRSGADLYRCEIPEGAEASGCSTLIDLTPPAAGSAESSKVQGVIVGFSADGTRAYFVAQGILDSRPNDGGASAVAGGANLYLWQKGQGVRFVATLDQSADESDWGLNSSPYGQSDILSAAASPNGLYLTFMSERPLTGYDNRDADSRELAQEIFSYDAVTDQLDCISCNPTGAAPEAQAGQWPLADHFAQWEDDLAAAMLPEPTRFKSGTASGYRPRTVFDSGRVFFNAIDSLVPADSNGELDVYQYEPVGVGDCTSGSGGASVARAAGGCVSLISSGTAADEAAFLDASSSGDDVFFLTVAGLSVFDEDDELDVYDARVGGTAATRGLITECLGEACQAGLQPPNDPTPASAAFHGHGNVKASRNCRALALQAAKLRRRLLSMRHSGGHGGEAARLAQKAHVLRKKAKRCRHANRGTGR